MSSNTWGGTVWFGRGALAAGTLVLFLSACAEVRESPLGPRYHATNVFGLDNSAVTKLRRVAFLPLAVSDSSSDLQAGAETLEPVLLAELQKKNRFEIVPVSRVEMTRWTGKPSLRGDEVLPEGFPDRITKETGCDGILFSALTVFHPYTPAAIGWRLKLVAVQNKSIVWAADQVFDAASTEVANSARDYQRKQPELRPGLREGRKILLSPTAFGRYSAAALLDTLPPYPR
jgi:hypothetical protein